MFEILITAHVLDVFARVIAAGGDGIVVASMAGHREGPYGREIEHALATTEASQLLALPFLQAEQVGSSVHAYAPAKRGNSLRVLIAAAAWGKRGARINNISPGVIITPLALDELSPVQVTRSENVRWECAAKRFSTSDEVATFAAFQ